MIRVGTAAPPAEGWDIHCHTVFSDGTETPRALLQEARALQLHGVAIADHDTTSGWQDALAASRGGQIAVVTRYGNHCRR